MTRHELGRLQSGISNLGTEMQGVPDSLPALPRGTYLVTGGCGFIGSHLCEALLRQGHAVRVLDDLSSGKLSNLPDGVELLRGDVTEPEDVRLAVEGIAGCFHLAAIASVERGVRDWLGTHRVNASGMVTLLDALSGGGGAGPVPVVYASSAAVYGDCQDLPLEEDAPTRPLSAYGADKLSCELHARVATTVHGIPTVGLRFFNVYGPRQDPSSPYSGVISIFCDRLRRGLPVTVFGDGGQSRDFIFVADVVTALMAAMAIRPAGSPVFNVCTGRRTSVLDLAHTIAELCGTAADLRFGPARQGEVRHSLGSPQRADQLLGTRSRVPLDAGLARVLGWMSTETASADGR